MRRAADSFKGETPLLSARLLPENSSTKALNSRLYTGDLTAFRQFSLTTALANGAPVQTIALMDGYWLSWTYQVDVARGIIPGDTTYRTYLTSASFSVPQFTYLSLATTGAPPYPVATRPLGVPPPVVNPTAVAGASSTPTSTTVNITDPCNDLATNWVLSPGQTAGGSTYSSVTQSVSGAPLFPGFRVQAENNPSVPAYATRDFGTSGATTVGMSVQMELNNVGGNLGGGICCMFACGAAGDGIRLEVYGDVRSGPGTPTLYVQTGTGFAAGNGSIQNSASGPAGTYNTGIVYTITANMIANSDGTQTITANLFNGTTLLCTVVATVTVTVGGIFGPIFAKGADYLEYFYSNLTVTGTIPVASTVVLEATSYVYTFVNDLGEESAPSIPTATVLRDDSIAVTITLPGAAPAGTSAYVITHVNIYRSVTGNTGTAFLFVAQVPIATTTYVDTLDDTALGEILISTDWDLPPADMQGILALPNGVMAGFSKNNLCLSAQNYPHAWPINYQLTTDTNIVGIANIDTTIVIGTKSFVYVASGNDPANYSMAKFEVPHAASSKLSFAYITGLGVVFSGPDGLMVCAGINQLRNLTETIFTKDQWAALSPASITSVAYNDIYFMGWNNGTTKGTYAVDLRADGFGVVEMAWHSLATYVDPVADLMYTVLDQDTEPDNAALPVHPTLPSPLDSEHIFQFEGSTSVLMTFSWTSKLWLNNNPDWYAIAQVKRDPSATGNLLLLTYGDGVLLDTLVITSDTEFTLKPPAHAYSTFQFTVLGTDTVRVVQMANEVEELT